MSNIIRDDPFFVVKDLLSGDESAGKESVFLNSNKDDILDVLTKIKKDPLRV